MKKSSAFKNLCLQTTIWMSPSDWPMLLNGHAPENVPMTSCHFMHVSNKALSVEGSLCVVCSYSNHFPLLSFGVARGPFSQLTVCSLSLSLSLSVCVAEPLKTLSQLTALWVFAPHSLSLCFKVSQPPADPQLPCPLCPFLRLYSHEVYIPHLLCRLQTKEQKEPLLTCGKHSSLSLGQSPLCLQ